jgi:hypothetical protein
MRARPGDALAHEYAQWIARMVVKRAAMLKARRSDREKPG